MKYTKSDYLSALAKLELYRKQGDDAYANFWLKKADEIAAWLEAKKARAAKRRELKKAGLWKQTPTIVSTPSTSPAVLPALNWANPAAALVAYTRYILDAEGAGKCGLQVRGQRASSYFRPGANYIRFSNYSISYLLHNPFQEYKTVRWVWAGAKNVPGEVALKMLALHEAAHAIDYARYGYCHHHQSQYQAILRELVQKYAEMAYVPAPVPTYA